MPTFAVTGASGPFGRTVVSTLLARGVAPAEIVAVVRTPAKAADLAERGVVVREGDYSRPETLPAALAGVERVLLVSGNEVGRRVDQHAAVVDAARGAGVELIAYTSILRAGATGNPLAPEHEATEQAIRESGLPWTFLRNGWYDENYTGQLAQYVERGEIVGAAGAGRVSGAPRGDYAEAAAAVLLGEGHEGRAYELGGPAFDFPELAAVVSRVAGREVIYRDLPADDYRAVLQGAGLDEGTARFVVAIDEAIARGELETSSTALEELLRRPVTPLAEAFAAAAASGSRG
jgi:NAD(P)H dehydrogenase (quinone)